MVASRPFPIRYSPLNHAVASTNHRIAVSRNDAAGDQIFQMGQHGIAGRAGQARIDADIDGAHHGRDVGFAFGEPMQDRGLAGLAMPGKKTYVTLGFRNFRPMALEIQILVACFQPRQ
jgi:hypothetical protein